MAEKVKVAVLGGGVSALAAAYALTSDGRHEQYDVTLYQLGWRLGGKGASGRNQALHDRIEEHGLHIWFGFYENAFKWMRDAYVQMDRKTGPITTWEQAFCKHSYVVLEEKMATGMVPWTFVFPTNSDRPGEGGILPSPLAYAEMALEWLIEWLEGRLRKDFANAADVGVAAEPAVPPHVDAVHAEAVARGPQPRPDRKEWHAPFLADVSLPAPTHPATKLAKRAHDVLRSLSNDPRQHSAVDHNVITWLLREMMKVAWFFLKKNVDTDLATRQMWVAINLTGSAVVGMIEDGVLFHGFDALDRWDLRDWLRKGGANDVTLESGPIRGIYDLVFGFIGGDTKRGAFAAGTAMRGILRMLFTYKGALMYRMEAGMGDIVATPFYEVLKKRGVKFEFFHRVLNLDVEGDRVHRISVRKQVKLKNGAYDPLIDAGGVPSWPSAPLYDQIVDGDELRASKIDLESSWAPRWKQEEDLVLELGKDFDHVVLGISVAALKQVAKPLIARNARFAAMVEGVATTQTQALQVWIARDTAAIGWNAPVGVNEGPVLGAFHEPIDTWADMSDLLPREQWGDAVKSLHYFCGPFVDAAYIPPFSDHEFPRQELARYAEIANPFLASTVRELWPKLQAGDVVSTYLRVNIDPTERYVLSVPNSTELRLGAKESGFANVILCGDWTANGFNAGCVEASVMSGLLASNALCGAPRLDEIVGLDGKH